MRELRGTNAILTGASRGLGVPIAIALAKEGVNLALAARNADQLEIVREQVVAEGVKTVCIPTDVGDRAQLEALVERTEVELGPPDILVNNAGIEHIHPYEEYPPEEIEQLLQINLVGPMLLTRFVLPGMLARGRGHIVQVASLAGKGGAPLQAPYAASKAGLVMATHALRAELVDSPVGTSVVCPGFVATEGMYADVVAATGEKASRLIGESKPKAVADAVVKAIKSDAAELIVNPSPMRPLLALMQVFPDVTPRVYKLFGVTEQARRTAAALKR